jgi:hypothetical protein
MAWKDIPGTAGVYQASDAGQIRSLDRTVLKRNRWGQVAPYRNRGRVLKPWRDCQGYAVVYICVEGGRVAMNVHRLVALAFHGEPAGRMDVNHIDGDKTNDAAANLEWCTRSENMLHARRIGLLRPPRAVVATPADGGAPLLFDSVRAAAASLRTDVNYIYAAMCGMYPSARGYVWRYAETH